MFYGDDLHLCLFHQTEELFNLLGSMGTPDIEPKPRNRARAQRSKAERMGHISILRLIAY
jgi:hypothetical protein